MTHRQREGMSKKKKRKHVERVFCPNCGELEQPQYVFVCPECYAEGCSKKGCIMPFGRGCRCIECDESL